MKTKKDVKAIKVVKTKAKAKAKQLVKPKSRMLIADDAPFEHAVDVQPTPDDPKLLVFPCKECGGETNPSTRAATEDGRIVHIGCPKAKRAAVMKPVLSGLPKHRGAKVPSAPQPPPSEYGDIAVKSDYQGRTCIQVKRDVATVTFIPMDVSGFHCVYMPTDKFDERYKLIEKYPTKKACEHYRDYAVEYGATDDVLRHLGKVVVITEEQANMAKDKMSKKVTKVNADGTTTVKTKGGGGGGSKKPGSGVRIRELIMKGWDADRILETIHKEFPGSKAAKSDVAWNRGKLKKDGEKVPELPEKKAEKAAPKKAAEKKAAPKKAKK